MRRRRSQLGLTGTDLALRAGISTSYVSLIETGAKVP
jgi:predicted transcriptional regulator